MASARISMDEIYPAYYIDDSGRIEIELSDEEVEQVESAWSAWDAAQDMIARKYAAAEDEAELDSE